MQLDEALTVAVAVKRARVLAGPYTDVPYSQSQLVDALVAIVDHVGPKPVSHEEHVKVIRQLTAATARLAKHEKAGGVSK